MKKKLAALLALSVIASMMTACGSSDTKEAETEATTVTETETETETEVETEEEEEDEDEDEDDEDEDEDEGDNEDFSLLDVSADMVDVGVYAKDDSDNELVFTMFTAPDGTDYASLFIYCPDGTGDVICGEYEADVATDEDGITWTSLTVSDVYTGEEAEIGFGEADGEVYIFDTEGNPFEGTYLSEDETINYMAAAVVLLSGDETSEDEEDGDEKFTLLDVSADMVDVGVYAKDDSDNELVFTMFTAPDGTDYASLFIYCPDGTGDVICGEYTAETATDDDGIAWTVLTVSDVYTGAEAEIGFGEADDEVCILDNDGNVFEGEYLSEDDTITYMGAAYSLLG